MSITIPTGINPIKKFIIDMGIDIDEYRDIENEVYSSMYTQPLLRAFHGFDIDVAFFVGT